MNERVLPVTRVAVGCLYPEPGAARVEDELVRLVLTAEVHGRKYLDVEEICQVLFQESTSVDCRIVFDAIRFVYLLECQESIRSLGRPYLQV